MCDKTSLLRIQRMCKILSDTDISEPRGEANFVMDLVTLHREINEFADRKIMSHGRHR